jgi:hypothetical protein
MLHQVLTPHPGDRRQFFGRAQRAIHHFVNRLTQRSDHPFMDKLQEFLLAAKAVVETALGHSGRGSDTVHGRALEPIFGQDGHSAFVDGVLHHGIEKLFPPFRQCRHRDLLTEKP